MDATDGSHDVEKTEVPKILRQLIDLFEADAERYRSNAFKEMSVRTEFINPILEELGWDPSNKRGSRYSLREVVQEDSVRIDGGEKAPDYAFQIEGVRQFFLEAKRPQVNIGQGKSAAYQIRRYCWSAGLPFGVLTDFEEFAVYDCRAIPDPADDAPVGRLEYFSYKDLPAKWPYLKSMFSRDAVGAGALDLMASASRAPRGTQPIDSAFLDEIRAWRSGLAADVAKRNDSLDVVELNRVVQTTIDRLVFLRIAEARGLEPHGALKSATEGPNAYSGLLEMFKRADDRYNSGLFHFHSDANISASPDETSLELEVGNEVVSRIVSRMYFPEPYEFSVLPGDILGRIYEQFLGEVVQLSKDRSVKVQLKPENRKAGGVYYTPSPIVQHIVEETVGPLLQGKSPQEVEKLKIVDPACGSGSFLIFVFQHLIDWHVEHYRKSVRQSKKFLENSKGGQVRLVTSERKKILVNNIFGVDIDPQAVEVSKLSLLLKVIEGQEQLELAVGRVLPDLEKNVLCGNSLIGDDFPMPLGLSHSEELAYNPFSWTRAFPFIFAVGGFDAVVGNPPYLNVDNVWGASDLRLDYLSNAYREIYTDKTDILFYFLKKAVDICRGEIGFIVSRSFLEADKAQKLRGWLGSNARIRRVLDFRRAVVFPGVGINTAIVSLTHSRAPKSVNFSRFRLTSLPAGYTPRTFRDTKYISTTKVSREKLTSNSWLFGTDEIEHILAKIDSAGVPVGDILVVGEGMQAGRNSAFYFDAAAERKAQLRQDGLLFTRARNSDIDRYSIRPGGPDLLYVEDVRSFAHLPGDVQAHLEGHRDELEARAAFKRGNCLWWRFSWPLHRSYARVSRIYCPYRSTENRFAVDWDADWLGLTDTTVLYDAGQRESLDYIAAILNTRILSARFRYIGKLLGGGVVEYYKNTVRKLAVPRIGLSDPRHDEIVALARDYRELHETAKCRLF